MWTELTREQLIARQAEIDEANPVPYQKHKGPYFDNQLPMPIKQCQNAHKAMYQHCCDATARTGFSTCQGCADNSRGDL